MLCGSYALLQGIACFKMIFSVCVCVFQRANVSLLMFNSLLIYFVIYLDMGDLNKLMVDLVVFSLCGLKYHVLGTSLIVSNY